MLTPFTPLAFAITVLWAAPQSSKPTTSDEPTIAERPANEWLADYKRADAAGREQLLLDVFAAANPQLPATTIPFFLGWLQDPDPVVRVAACECLRFTEDPDRASAAALKERLADDDPRVRVNAAVGLLHVTNEAEPSLGVLRELERAGEIEVRRKALSFLHSWSRLDPTLVELMLQELHADDPSLRKTALWGLRDFEPRDERCLPAMKELMSDADEGVRVLAAYRVLAAGEASDEAISILQPAIDSADDVTRLTVVRGLASAPLGSAADVLPGLIHALRDRVTQNRAEAINALSSFGQQGVDAPEATAELIALLEDPDAYTRTCAALALGHIGAETKEVLPPLVKHLTDPDAQMRYWVHHSLQQGGADVVFVLPELIEALRCPDAETRSRAAGVISLGGPSAKAAIPELAKRFDDPAGDVRVWSAYALRQIGPESIVALPRFVAALARDKEPKVRVEAARAIAALGALAGSASDALVAACSDPEPDVRLWSLYAIGEVGVKSAATLAVLRAAAAEGDASVVAQANKSLARLGEEHDEAAISNEPMKKPAPEPVSSMFTYATTSLVVSNAQCAAVFGFLDESGGRDGDVERHTVKYQWRFLAKGQAQPTAGDGELVDITHWTSASTAVGDADPSARELHAGPLRVGWGFSAKGIGLLSWVPEEMHLEIVASNWYESIDLARFIR